MFITPREICLSRPETLNILLCTGLYCGSDSERRLFEATLPQSARLLGCRAIGAMPFELRLEQYRDAAREDLNNSGFRALEFCQEAAVWPFSVNGQVSGQEHQLVRMIDRRYGPDIIRFLSEILHHAELPYEVEAAESSLRYITTFYPEVIDPEISHPYVLDHATRLNN